MIKIIKIAVKLIKKPKLDLFLFFSLTALATLLEIFSIGIILPLLQNLMSGDLTFTISRCQCKIYFLYSYYYFL